MTRLATKIPASSAEKPASPPKAENPAPPCSPRPADVATARFVLTTQLHLLEYALATWTRRDTVLLDINCGGGAFLPFLWGCGFWVDAIEKNPQARARAKMRCPTANIMAGSDDDLPIEDKAYDWALLHLQNPQRLNSAIAEARRVARRGFAITFWNRHSLPGICARMVRTRLPGAATTWWEVHRAFRRMADQPATDRITSTSALGAPMMTWHAASPLARCNYWLKCWPFGAWVVYRCSLGPAGSVTPLALRLGASLRHGMNKSLSAPEPALECGNKSLSSRTDDPGKEKEAS